MASGLRMVVVGIIVAAAADDDDCNEQLVFLVLQLIVGSKNDHVAAIEWWDLNEMVVRKTFDYLESSSFTLTCLLTRLS